MADNQQKKELDEMLRRWEEQRKTQKRQSDELRKQRQRQGFKT